MIALVEFDCVIEQEAYKKLKDIYNFGDITSRVYKSYDGKYYPLSEGKYFRDEVKKLKDKDGNDYYILQSEADENSTSSEKRIVSYQIEDRAKGDWIGITNTKHVVDLKELYTACRTIQVRILEVARMD